MAALTCPSCSTSWETDATVLTGQHCPKCGTWAKVAGGVTALPSEQVTPATDSTPETGEVVGTEPLPSGAVTLETETTPDPVGDTVDDSGVQPDILPVEASQEPDTQPVPTLIRENGTETNEPVTAKPKETPALVQKETMPRGTELPRPAKPSLAHLPPRGIAGYLQEKGIWTFHK